MRCPFCGELDTAVKDSRPGEDHSAIRRRRSCRTCEARFTTFERVQLRELTVLKDNGSKEPFDREKILRSITTAARKLNIHPDQLEEIVSALVRKFELSGDAEISTQTIGDRVLDALLHLNEVACLRFASVYKNFQGIHDFQIFIGQMSRGDGPRTPPDAE